MSDINLGLAKSVPDNIEVVSWSEHGYESFDGHATFWLPAHIKVNANWDDEEVLKSLSGWLDDKGFRVFERHEWPSGSVALVPEVDL